jgi:hypothetical protein
VLTALSLPFDVKVVTHKQGEKPIGASYDEIKNYATVIWYKGDSDNPVSSTAHSNLSAYLDLGDRRALIFSSEEYNYLRLIDGLVQPTEFLADYAGQRGGRAGCVSTEITAVGVPDKITSSLNLRVATAPLVFARYGFSTFQELPGTDILLTTNTTKQADCPVNIISAKRRTSKAENSKAIVVTFYFENITDIGSNSKQNLMQMLLSY